MQKQHRNNHTIQAFKINCASYGSKIQDSEGRLWDYMELWWRKHKVKTKLELSGPDQSFLIPESWLWKRKMDPLIISEHSGAASFLLVDILIWEGIMKAIRSSPRLSHWAHNPFVTCLPSALRTSTFLFGFLSALRLCHHHYDTKAWKLCVKGRISHNAACVCCWCCWHC